MTPPGPDPGGPSPSSSHFTTRELYALSKTVVEEAFLDGQMSTAGANQASLLEKLEKNARSNHMQAVALKYVFAFLLGFMSVLHLISVLEVNQALARGPVPHATILMASSLVMGVGFAAQFMYVLLMGMQLTAGLMSGSAFRWLQTLPLSRRDVDRLTYLALFRSYNAPVLAAIVTVPVVLGILTRNPLVTVVALGVTTIQTLLAFGLLVLFGERLTRILGNYDVNSKKANVVRLLALGGMFIGLLLVSLLFQVAFRGMSTILVEFQQAGEADLGNALVSLIPFPCAGSYLISMVAYDPGQAPAVLWLTCGGGLALLAAITYGVTRKAQRALHHLVIGPRRKAFSKSEGHRKDRRPEAGGDRESHHGSHHGSQAFHLTTPTRAFLKKDLRLATRDYRMISMTILPVIYPVMFLAAALLNEPGPLVTDQGVCLIWTILLILQALLCVMILAGFLNTEKTGTAVLAALPLVPRDQARAKFVFLTVLPLASWLVSMLMFAGKSGFLAFLPLMASTFPLPVLMTQSAFQLNVRLFGKLRYKYVLDEVHVVHKFWKHAGVVAYLFGVAVGVSALGWLLWGLGGMLTVLVFLWLLEGGLTAGLVANFNRMFPKQEAARE